MRLIVILIVLAIVGVLAAQALKTQSRSVGDAARVAGASVPQGATPRQQTEAIGQAVEQIQKQQEEKTRHEIDEASGAK